MSNASPGTKPTLPAEDQQLLTQNKLNHEEKEKAKEKEQTADTFAALDDNVLRYSYKGTPPELYSPKKEFLYTQPLVEKQLKPYLREVDCYCSFSLHYFLLK
ncbi:hypothetical protein ACLKA7_011484 [Drosophila subpalustris]